LTKETDKRVKKRGETLSANYKSGKIKPSMKGKIQKEDSKKKISESMRRFFEKDPDRVPYKINHSSHDSWPEKIFENALKRHGIIGWVRRYIHGIYEYDFAFPEIKLDVEIDGKTHKTEKVKAIDKRRDEWSISLGWKVLRFDGSLMIKEVEMCIEKLKEYIKDKECRPLAPKLD